MMKALLDRRVPQLTGVYLAASWGLVEFSSFAVGQFALSPAISSLVVLLLLLLLPVVVILAWRHGEPGPSEWTKTDGAAIGLNLVVAAVVLFAAFSDQELGAATTIKLVEDAEGNTVERVVPKAAFRRNVLLYSLDNESGDPDLDWLETGVVLGVAVDLIQDVFVTPVTSEDATVRERLAEAGFELNDAIPLSLKREAAERRSIDHFMDGSVRSESGTLVVETRLYETRSARRVSVHSYRGADPLELADQVSVDLRHDLGIPNWQIEEAVDLPASELLTSSPDAYRAFVGAQTAATANDFATTRSMAGEAVRQDSTFAYGYLVGGIAAFFSGDQAAGRDLFARGNRDAYRLPERARLSMQVIEKWFFQQNPAGAIAAASYWTEIYPQDTEARRLLSNLYSATGDADGAIAQARALLAIDTADVQSMRLLATTFRQREDYDSALAYYERLGDRLPSDVQTRLDVAATRSSLGQFDLARTELEQAGIAAPADPDPVDRLARLDMREGEYGDAVERTARVGQLARTPLERTAAAGLEESLYYNRGQFSRLEDAYHRRLAGLAEFAPVIQILGSIENSEALRFAFEAGREAWALQQLDSLRNLGEAPWNLDLENAAVRIHLERGDVAAARASLEGLRRQRDELAGGRLGDATISWIEGRIAELEDGNCSRALDSYDRAKELAPLGSLYRVSRLRCFIAAKSWSEAQSEVGWLLERQPGSAKIRLEIARYHVARGQTAEAIEHLEVALDVWSEADANYIPAQEARALLKELRDS
jgi:Tfp pilus assembly protein PilF